MQIITCCVRSGAYEQDLQTLEVLGGGEINGCSIVVNSSNDEKQMCSVHHGVYKNSYSPCGGWYSASTDALVALVTQCFDTFCVGEMQGNVASKLAQNSEKCELQ